MPRGPRPPSRPAPRPAPRPTESPPPPAAERALDPRAPAPGPAAHDAPRRQPVAEAARAVLERALDALGFAAAPPPPSTAPTLTVYVEDALTGTLAPTAAWPASRHRARLPTADERLPVVRAFTRAALAAEGSLTALALGADDGDAPFAVLAIEGLSVAPERVAAVLEATAPALPALRRAHSSEQRATFFGDLATLHLTRAAAAFCDYALEAAPGARVALLLQRVAPTGARSAAPLLRIVGVGARTPDGLPDPRVARFVGYEKELSGWAARRVLEPRATLDGDADPAAPLPPQFVSPSAADFASCAERTKLRASLDERALSAFHVVALPGPDGQPFGALCLWFDPSVPAPASAELLALAEVAAGALAAVRGARAAQLSPFLHLNRVIRGPGVELGVVLGEVVEELRAFLQADAAAVTLVDDSTGTLLVAERAGYAHGDASAQLTLADDPAAPPRSISAHVVRTARPFLAPDTREVPFFLDLGDGFRSEVAAPLTAGGRVIGVVLASSRRPRYFASADRDRLQLFAGNVAWAIDDARLVARARAAEEGLVRRRQGVLFGLDKSGQASEVTYHFGNLVGDPDGPMGEVYRRIERIVTDAPDHATVLLTGETGTGKEVAAFALHACSQRGARPMVVANFAAFGGDPNLIQSELFGHERGAFTGAAARRIGCFERGDGTTLFIDEVGDIVPSVQVKLLRVLQGGRFKEFERLGGTEALRSDVRVLAATNQPLQALVRDGRFREDLFYRLNTFALHLPPLRARRRDVPLLAAHFLARHRADGAAEPHLTRAAGEALETYDWPGNVRQLDAVLARALFLYARDGRIDAPDVRAAIADEQQAEPPGRAGVSSGAAPTPAHARRDAAAAGAGPGDAGTDALYAAVRAAGPGAFWALVQAPFRERRLTRERVAGVIALALVDAEGVYRRAAEQLGVEPHEYGRFMDFLRAAGAKADFRAYRRAARS